MKLLAKVISLDILYVILSILIFFLYMVDNVLEKMKDEISYKYNYIIQKEKEIAEIEKKISNTDLSYTPEPENVVRFRMLEFIDHVSKKIPVILESGPTTTDGRVLVIGLKIIVENGKPEDIKYLLELLNINNFFVLIKNFEIEKNSEGGTSLNVELEIKQIFR